MDKNVNINFYILVIFEQLQGLRCSELADLKIQRCHGGHLNADAQSEAFVPGTSKKQFDQKEPQMDTDCRRQKRAVK